IQSSITVSLVCQPTAPTHYHFSSTTTAPTDTYTLSLHDALPISKDAWPQSHSDCPATKRSKKGTSKSFPDTRRSPGVTRAVSVRDRKSTRLNSSHEWISYAVFCLKKKNTTRIACQQMVGRWRAIT